MAFEKVRALQVFPFKRALIATFFATVTACSVPATRPGGPVPGPAAPARLPDLLTVQSVKGSATVLGERRPVSLKRGMVVFENRPIQVGSRSTVRLALGDRVLLELGPDTRLVVHQLPRDGTPADQMIGLRLERGDLHVMGPGLRKNAPLGVSFSRWAANVESGEAFFAAQADVAGACSASGRVRMSGVPEWTQATLENGCVALQVRTPPQSIALDDDAWRVLRARNRLLPTLAKEKSSAAVAIGAAPVVEQTLAYLPSVGRERVHPRRAAPMPKMRPLPTAAEVPATVAAVVTPPTIEMPPEPSTPEAQGATANVAGAAGAHADAIGPDGATLEADRPAPPSPTPTASIESGSEEADRLIASVPVMPPASPVQEFTPLVTDSPAPPEPPVSTTLQTEESSEAAAHAASPYVAPSPEQNDFHENRSQTPTESVAVAVVDVNSTAPDSHVTAPDVLLPPSIDVQSGSTEQALAATTAAMDMPAPEPEPLPAANDPEAAERVETAGALWPPDLSFPSPAPDRKAKADPPIGSVAVTGSAIPPLGATPVEPVASTPTPRLTASTALASTNASEPAADLALAPALSTAVPNDPFASQGISEPEPVTPGATLSTEVAVSEPPAAQVLPSAAAGTPMAVASIAPTTPDTTPDMVAPAAPPAPPTAEWIVNVASYAVLEVAQQQVQELIAKNYSASVREETVRGRTSYRVVIERLPTEAAAQSAARDLASREGLRSAWVLRKY